MSVKTTRGRGRVGLGESEKNRDNRIIDSIDSFNNRFFIFLPPPPPSGPPSYNPRRPPPPVHLKIKIPVTVRRGTSQLSHEKIGDCEQSTPVSNQSLVSSVTQAGLLVNHREPGLRINYIINRSNLYLFSSAIFLEGTWIRTKTGTSQVSSYY